MAAAEARRDGLEPGAIAPDLPDEDGPVFVIGCCDLVHALWTAIGDDPLAEVLATLAELCTTSSVSTAPRPRAVDLMAPHERSAWWLGIKVFREEDLEQLAGRDLLERARLLVDTIDDLYEDEWSICGTVHDDKPYLAMVHHAGHPLGCECACPDGEQGTWCEHVVAVGLCNLDEA